MSQATTQERLSDEQLAAINLELNEATPQEVLRWAVKEFHPKLLMATAFGAEGCCIIHMLSEIEPTTTLINLETGYQFPETLALRERLLSRYGMTVEYIRPELTVPEYEALHGGPLYATNSNQCCQDRKVIPLRRAMAHYNPRAWISAIRKDQTENRASNAALVQWDAKFKVVKVNPLLNWTKKQVWSFIMKHQVPYNPLHDQDYPSIGCWPCTRAVQAGEDDRAGRWSGQAKKECGLHVIDLKDGAGI